MNTTVAVVPVACVQLRSGLDVAANVRAASELIRAAAADGARYILTPENTGLMDEDKRRARACVGTMADDMAVAAFADLAAALKVHLHIGSLALKTQDADDRLVNRSILFGPDGGIVAYYDKIHLFDVQLGDGEKDYRESSYIRPGEKAVVTDAGGMKVGMSVCYDLRFPALYQALARAGAAVLTVPAAFTVPTGRAHWHVLLRARAIETGSFVLAAAQGGRHESGRATYGHSLIVSPWGEVLAEREDDQPGVIHATLDLDRVAEVRRRIPVLDNARAFTPPEG